MINSVFIPGVGEIEIEIDLSPNMAYAVLRDKRIVALENQTPREKIAAIFYTDASARSIMFYPLKAETQPNIWIERSELVEKIKGLIINGLILDQPAYSALSHDAGWNSALEEVLKILQEYSRS